MSDEIIKKLPDRLSVLARRAAAARRYRAKHREANRTYQRNYQREYQRQQRILRGLPPTKDSPQTEQQKIWAEQQRQYRENKKKKAAAETNRTLNSAEEQLLNGMLEFGEFVNYPKPTTGQINQTLWINNGDKISLTVSGKQFLDMAIEAGVY